MKIKQRVSQAVFLVVEKRNRKKSTPLQSLKFQMPNEPMLTYVNILKMGARLVRTGTILALSKILR